MYNFVQFKMEQLTPSVKLAYTHISIFSINLTNLKYLTIIHRSGGKYPPLSPTLR